MSRVNLLCLSLNFSSQKHAKDIQLLHWKDEIFIFTAYKRLAKGTAVLEMRLLLNHQPFDDSMQHPSSDNYKDVSEKLMKTVRVITCFKNN